MARLRRLPWPVLVGALLTVAGLALGWLWFRDSSFAAVERVTITGSGSSEQRQVREALETTARGMSTLRVDEQALKDVVEPYSSVAGLRVRADFPHDLRIEVIEHEPVAMVRAGGSSVPATGGGLVLAGAEAASAGAAYLDLRVPKLVAAGGVGPLTPEATATPSVIPSNPQP